MATTNPTPGAISMIHANDDTDGDDFYGSSTQASTNQTAHEFFMMLLQAAVVAHILHLRTRSFAEHMALETFYKELPELTDELIEGYQGKHGLVNQYPTTVTMPESDNGVKLLESLTLFIASNRAKVAPDTEIQNQIDEIQMLINTTANKLKFLS
jgi:hypothetical protein